MKTALTILLSSLLFCSCSHKQATSAHQAIDFVEAGKDVTWLGGYTLRVAKRDGSSIQGIRLITKAPDGLVTTITADKGTVSEGLYPNVVRITLFDATSQSTKARASIQKLTVDLSR